MGIHELDCIPGWTDLPQRFILRQATTTIRTSPFNLRN
jgi:hypothetical protein